MGNRRSWGPADIKPDLWSWLRRNLGRAPRPELKHFLFLSPFCFSSLGPHSKNQITRLKGGLFMQTQPLGLDSSWERGKSGKLTSDSLDIKNIKCNYTAIPRLHGESGFWYLMISKYSSIKYSRNNNFFLPYIWHHLWNTNCYPFLHKLLKLEQDC